MQHSQLVGGEVYLAHVLEISIFAWLSGIGSTVESSGGGKVLLSLSLGRRK